MSLLPRAGLAGKVRRKPMRGARGTGGGKIGRGMGLGAGRGGGGHQETSAYPLELRDLDSSQIWIAIQLRDNATAGYEKAAKDGVPMAVDQQCAVRQTGGEGRQEGAGERRRLMRNQRNIAPRSLCSSSASADRQRGRSVALDAGCWDGRVRMHWWSCGWGQGLRGRAGVVT